MLDKFFTYIYRNASSQCYSFFINGEGVMNFSNLGGILKFSGKKYKKNHMLGNITDPDRHALDADPDPAK